MICFTGSHTFGFVQSGLFGRRITVGGFVGAVGAVCDVHPGPTFGFELGDEDALELGATLTGVVGVGGGC